MFKIALLIPTLNGGKIWDLVLESIDRQSVKFDRKLIIDSGSNDGTVNSALKYGFDILKINRKEFDHGYARQLLADAADDCEILVYLTQDCILKDDESIKNLLTAFSDETVGIAYGRQLPRKQAVLLEAHARLFNYPPVSVLKSISDKNRLGIKVASCSNSFAAYRRKALTAAEGFPLNSIFGEDVIVGGKILLKGWKIYYVASAESYHSHNYTLKEEFERYFDIGVFHRNNYWLIENFGTANGEGLKFIKSEIKLVSTKNILLLPKVFFSVLAKWIGYKLGLNHNKLPNSLKVKLSMHKGYWLKKLI